jgi:hypothetical protein
MWVILKEFYAPKNLIPQTVETYFTFLNSIIYHNCGISETATPSALNGWTIQQITAQKHNETPSNLKFPFLRRRKLLSEECVLNLSQGESGSARTDAE